MFIKYNSIFGLLAVMLFCALLIMAGCANTNESDTGTGDGNGGGNGFDYNNPPDISYTKGVQVTLDHVDGLYDDTSIVTGEPITFYIKINNNTGSAINGLTNGFAVYTYENTGNWDTTVGGFTPNITADMLDGGLFLVDFNRDGSNVDTVAFGGYKIMGTGIPAGFNDIAFTIQIGPIDAANEGKWICLDSTFYSPGGAWLWSTDGGSVNPDWDGARWFKIVDTSTPRRSH